MAFGPGGTTLTGNSSLLKFSVTWKGTAGTAWETPANWSCNAAHDGFVDVIINPSVPNYPQVNSYASCRSLKLGNGVVFMVGSGFVLDIKGK